MADKSGIEWTDATWNPIAGCSIVSPGCTNCYAMRVAGRMEAISIAHEASHGGDPGPMLRYRGTTEVTRHGKAVWTGKVNFVPEVLTAPLRWKRPRRIFVNSMSDLFGEGVEDEWIDQIFAVMALCPQHQFQVLTKRPERMRAYLSRGAGGGKQDIQNHLAWEVTSAVLAAADISWKHLAPNEGWRAKAIQACTIWPLPNVWLGTSVENQHWADVRIPHLLETPAAVCFISAEPLLGDLDLEPYLLPVRQWSNGWANNYPFTFPKHQLDWVIAGGESGPGARPMHPDWARSLRDQCAAAGVPFFFKQWGEWSTVYDRNREDPDWRRCGPVEADTPRGQWLNLAGGQGFHGECVVRVDRTGKKRNGRHLDGVQHDAMPVTTPAEACS